MASGSARVDGPGPSPGGEAVSTSHPWCWTWTAGALLPEQEFGEACRSAQGKGRGLCQFTVGPKPVSQMGRWRLKARVGPWLS